MAPIEHLSFPDVSVSMDARYFPVVINTWTGVMTVEMAHAFITRVEALAERAHEQDVRFILIGDMSGLRVKPSQEVRTLFAKRIDALDVRRPGRLLAILSIVDGAFMRGLVAMVVWLMRRRVRVHTVASMADGITRARRMLEVVGIAVPDGLDPGTYERPGQPSRAS